MRERQNRRIRNLRDRIAELERQNTDAATRQIRRLRERIRRLEEEQGSIQLGIHISPELLYGELHVIESDRASDEAIERVLTAEPAEPVRRRYEVREIIRNPIREVMPRVDVSDITFRFDDADIPAGQLDKLDRIARVISRIVERRPDELFLIEGHTDAVGDWDYNLVLSEERAEAVRDALVNEYGIPRRNLEIAGYGEEYLKVPTEERERRNRRVTVRRITPLVAGR